MSQQPLGECPSCGTTQISLDFEQFGSNVDGDEIHAFKCQDCDAILGVSQF